MTDAADSQTHPLELWRLRNGFSRKELAEKLRLKRLTIWRWETGRQSPTLDNMIAVLELTDEEVTPDGWARWAMSRPAVARCPKCGASENSVQICTHPPCPLGKAADAA